jgi:putative hemolysin
MTLALLLIAVAALILLNGFFVAAEYGLVTARRTAVQELADDGNRRARLVLRILADPPRFIAAMQLGVTATSLGIGALGEPVLQRVFHPALASVLAVILAFLIITFFHVVIGELMPKGIALAYSERVALAVSAPVRGFFVLFKPLIWVLQRSSDAGLNALGLEAPSGEGGVLSEAELKMLLSRSTEEGEIEHEEREMLYNVFDFADKEVSDVMVPRPEVVALAIDTPPEECLKTAVESPYTRYPVYRGSLDEVIGVLHVRDLFRAATEAGDIARVELEPLLRKAHIVPETKDLAALLREFRRTKEHMAVVVDEYGAMEGIVTLEDLLEEIVGEIEDEFDLPDESVEQVDDHRIRIDGTFTIDDFNEQFHVSLPEEDYNTVGGFVFGELGHAPHDGDTVEHDGLRFTVFETDGNRIERLEVEFHPVASRPKPEEGPEADEAA